MLDLSFSSEGYPRGVDLPDTDGIPMDSEVHRETVSRFLIEPLKLWLEQHRVEAFVGGNSFVYFPAPQPARMKSGHLKPLRLGPDFYVVLGGRAGGQTKWVVWEEENRYPSLIVELLSPSTEGHDRGKKFLIYRDQWKTQDYFLFDCDNLKLEGFQLKRGAYIATTPDSDGHHPAQTLPLKLGVHQGWLRWFDKSGQLVLTEGELERKRADQAQERADQAQSKAEKLAARLRALGLDPDSEE